MQALTCRQAHATKRGLSMFPFERHEVAVTARAARNAGLELHRHAPFWTLRKPEDNLFTGFTVRRVGDDDLGRFDSLAQVRYYLQSYSAA